MRIKVFFGHGRLQVAHEDFGFAVGRDIEHTRRGRHERRLVLMEDDSGAILVGEATRAGERHDDDKRVDTADVIRERMRQVSHIGGEKRAAHHFAQSVRSLDVVRAGVRRNVSESYSLLGELGVEFAQVGNLDEVLGKRAG